VDPQQVFQAGQGASLGEEPVQASARLIRLDCSCRFGLLQGSVAAAVSGMSGVAASIVATVRSRSCNASATSTSSTTPVVST
jgi:predicted transcriptional regulator